MSGSATFSGTTYQAKVIAFAYAHVLSQSSLNWVAPSGDLPIAVWGETGDGGDDARVDLGDGRGSIEVQAKHGLTAGAELDKVLDRFIAHPAHGSPPIALVIDHSSSKKLFNEFARDLDRLRGGRTDALSAETDRVRARLGKNAALLERLSVCALDVDRPSDAGITHATHLLERVLDDRSQASAAWSVLVDDAGRLCAARLRRTRKELADLLASKGMKVLPAPKDEKWHRRLELTRSLLVRGQNAAAVIELKLIQADIADTKVEPQTRYRLAHQRAAAEIRLGNARPALEFALRALDTDPTGVEALSVAATAAVELGDVKRAQDLAETAINAHANDGRAWGLAALVAQVKGVEWPTPPPDVAESTSYLLNIASLAASKDDHKMAVEICERLYGRGECSAEVLFYWANSLMQRAFESEDIARGRYEKAERIASELIDTHPGHPFVVKALVVRSGARRQLGKISEADQDLLEARLSSSGDVDAIRQAAQVRLQEGDAVGAAEVLRHPAVDSEASLLALRAGALALGGDKSRGSADLAAAVKLLESAETPEPEVVWIFIIEAAIRLTDLATAERLLKAAPRGGLDPEYWSVLEGRMAFARNDLASGTAALRAAIGVNGSRRDRWTEELAMRLLHKGSPADAVKVFEELGFAKLGVEGLRDFASALMQSNDLLRAKALVDHLKNIGDLPTWGVQLAAHLALLQEDVDAAVEHLAELISRGHNPVRSRLDLTRALIEGERLPDAQKQIEQILALADGLQPIERAHVAQLLSAIGRHEQALAEAFNAYREAQQDPQTHRVLIGVALTGRVAPPPVEVVGPETYVRLRTEHGELRERLILSSGSIDRVRSEISVTDAEQEGLLGKRVGESITKDRGKWTEEKWTIEEILPAITFTVRDALEHFEERFPSEEFLVRRFKIGDGASLRAMAPLIASVEARKREAKTTFDLYRKELMPLGFVARVLGGNIPAVMRAIAADPDSGGLVPTEWWDPLGQAASRRAAAEAQTVVLTRSALQVIWDLKLNEVVSKSFNLLSPRSLLRELRAEAKEVEECSVRGLGTLVGAETGIRLIEVEAGSPGFQVELGRIHAQLAWLDQHSRIAPRPLASIHSEDSSDDLREHLGASSADALDLARHEGATLYADDLGLRRMLEPNRSFSTLGLVRGLVDRRVIDESARDEWMLDLLERGHGWVVPTSAFLDAAIRRYGRTAPSKLATAFASLGAQGVAPGDAAKLAAQVIRTHATTTIQILSVDELTVLVLNGMLTRWPLALSCHQVLRAVTDSLILLPQVVRAVEQAVFRHMRKTLSLNPDATV